MEPSATLTGPALQAALLGDTFDEEREVELDPKRRCIGAGVPVEQGMESVMRQMLVMQQQQQMFQHEMMKWMMTVVPGVPRAASPGATPAPTQSEFRPADQGIPKLFKSDVKQEIVETKELAPELKLHIRKCAKKFKENVLKKLSWQHRAEVHAEQLREMSVVDDSGVSCCRYPTGVRPFASAKELEELDEPYGPTMQEASSLVIVVPQGSSIRDAMRFAHHGLAKFCKGCMRDASAAHAASLVVKATRESFLEACSEWKPSELDALGLEEATVRVPSQATAMKEALRCYDEVVIEVRRHADEEKKRAAKSEKDKNDLETKLVEAKPATAMREFVNLVLDERSKTRRGSDDPEAMEEVDINEVKKVRQSVDDAAEKAAAKIRAGPKNEKPGERPAKKRPSQDAGKKKPPSTTTSTSTTAPAAQYKWKATEAFKYYKPEWITERDAKMKYTWNQERWKYWPGQQPGGGPHAKKGAGKGGKPGEKGCGKGHGKGGR